MPIGLPSQRPEPKSACTESSSPIERMISAEFGATGSLSRRWFHGFEVRDTGQPAICGEDRRHRRPSASTARSAAALERIEHRAAPRGRRLEQAEEEVPGGRA
jgi:hypothetical protein